MLHKFNISFLLSYFNQKVLSISSLYLLVSKYCANLSFWLVPLQSSTHLASTSYTYKYQHFEYQFVAFATLVWKTISYHRFTDISQSCAKHVFYIGFVDIAGNLCLLCWHYFQCFCHLLCS